MNHDDVEQQVKALNRLLEIAASDTGQSRRVADFLLAWWNAAACGGFDLTDIWTVDQAIADDMLAVIAFIRSSKGKYPDRLGYRQEFEELIEKWRPALLEASR